MSNPLNLSGDAIHKVLTYRGFQYYFDLRFAAHNRAEYYAQRDPDTTYDDEYDFATSDGMSEAYEWASNNMDPVDWPEGYVEIVAVSFEPVSLRELNWTYDESR